MRILLRRIKAMIGYWRGVWSLTEVAIEPFNGSKRAIEHACKLTGLSEEETNGFVKGYNKAIENIRQAHLVTTKKL